MKKIGIINQPISAVISDLGHTDTIVVADAGLPIPIETERIDLALKKGVPTFFDTLTVVLEEMFVEKAYVSKEIKEVSPQVYTKLQELLGDVPIEELPHEEFKNQTRSARAIIRTGEFTPYSNVILVSGPWGFDV